MKELKPIQSQQVLSQLSIGIAVLESGARLCWANPALSLYLGKPVEDLPDVIASVLGPELEPGLTGRVDQVEGQDGRLRKLLYSVDRLDDDSLLLSVTDISGAVGVKFGKLRRGLLNIATRVDSVTGALARDSVFQELVSQVSRSRRYQNPLTVVLMRVTASSADGARTIELKGERYRRTIVQALKQRLRWVDSLGVWDICNHLQALQISDAEGKKLAVKAWFTLTEWKKGDEPLGLIERLAELMNGELEQTIAVG
jgi:hypothetical protein